MTDNRNYTHAHDNTHVCGGHHVCAMAIVVGALVAIGLGYLANLFSLAVGLSAFPVSAEGKTAFAAAGFIWLVVLAIITMFIAGWVAGYLGRPFSYKRRMGEIYGFSAWALALFLTIILAGGSMQYLAQRAYLVDRSNPAMTLTNEMASTVTGNQTRVTSAPRANTTTEEQAENLGVIAFATFFVLFIGAISAAFGGRVGMRRKHVDEHGELH